MALTSDAVMVIFCDVADDAAGHDDWHTYEHMHERLSIPGFLRGTRWIRTSGRPAT
jgi:spermidine synthase